MKPSELELKILQYIWSMDNCAAVQQILDAWTEEKKPGYTTILKTLQIMEKKNLVSHRKEGKAYKYIPLISRKEVYGVRIGDIVNGLFGGSKPEFINTFIGTQKISMNDLEEMKRIIKEKEKELEGENDG